jgi:hypothetical protein
MEILMKKLIIGLMILSSLPKAFAVDDITCRVSDGQGLIKTELMEDSTLHGPRKWKTFSFSNDRVYIIACGSEKSTIRCEVSKKIKNSKNDFKALFESTGLIASSGNLFEEKFGYSCVSETLFDKLISGDIDSSNKVHKRALTKNEIQFCSDVQNLTLVNNPLGSGHGLCEDTLMSSTKPLTDDELNTCNMKYAGVKNSSDAVLTALKMVECVASFAAQQVL